MSLRFESAASVSLAEYAAAFAAGFEGYLLPFSMGVGDLARRVRLGQYDLENSLVAYEGGEVVGVAALAVRGEEGWVAGFGVVPRRRRSGVGREMMSALVERARGCGLRRLSLEVLSGNEGARRLYESAGMRVARDLLIMERGERAGAGPAPPEVPSAALLAHFARLHRARPAWQRDLPSLLVASLRGPCVGEPVSPRAYALVGRARDGGTYVSDLAAEDADAARELCALLDRLAPPLKLVNEPEESLFVGPLREHGFAETGRQHEMHMDL
jgi:GNAT superfamily N-acetyltransferase